MNITALLSSTASHTLSTTSGTTSNTHTVQQHHLSRQILSLRKRLHVTNPPPKSKSHGKSQKQAASDKKEKKEKSRRNFPLPTATEVGQNHDFVRLYLLLASRAHAQAMAMKEAHITRNPDGTVHGPARSHIISRLHKASHIADELVKLLTSHQTETGAVDNDILEATAYARHLTGTEELEKHVGQKYSDAETQSEAWKKCLTFFSESHVLYAALLTHTKKELFRETLSSSVEPSIRYAAYQSGISRSIPISAIAQKNFRKDQTALISKLTSIDPSALTPATPNRTSTKTTSSASGPTPSDLPTTLTFRSHTAPLSDATISTIISLTRSASHALSKQYTTYLSQNAHASQTTFTNHLSTLYDPVLTQSTDTLSAVSRALSDLSRQGIPESDKRIQDLRLVALYANYTLIHWRIGRNRVLLSPSLDDGREFHLFSPSITSTTTTSDKKKRSSRSQTETPTHALHRLQTRIALLDAILQSLATLPSLPGAARLSGFTDSIARKRAYFRALRLLNIAYSHAVLINSGVIRDFPAAHAKRAEILALVSRALEVLQEEKGAPADDDEDGEGEDANTAPTSRIPASQFAALLNYLKVLEIKHRASLALHDRLSSSPTAGTKTPLINNLNTFTHPSQLDLTNLTPFPPAMEPVPVKPVFLDGAFGFVKYPGREDESSAEEDASMKGGMSEAKQAEKGEKKRGWFGFGR